MEMFTPLKPERASSLGLALVVSSSTPLLLLNEQLLVMAASGSFCRAYALDCDTVVGKELFALGDGEWDIPQLRVLLRATASGQAAIDAYEMDFKRAGEPNRCLVLNAHVLDYPESEVMRLVLSAIDVTKDRQDARDKDDLVRNNALLLQELHHRVANSLQIISSVLMQRVRGVQSEEARGHLRDAHHRVMSIATLQRQLAATATGEVKLGPYLTELCASIGASMIADHNLVTLTVTADDTVTDAEQSVSIGLIVTELAINALKHAFPSLDSKGSITVDFQTTGQAWSLTVGDDGVGMNGNHVSAKPGLGTGIVKALAGQLKATVVVSDQNPGTLVTVTHRTAQ